MDDNIIYLKIGKENEMKKIICPLVIITTMACSSLTGFAAEPCTVQTQQVQKTANVEYDSYGITPASVSGVKFPPRKDGYSGWMKFKTYNSSTKIDKVTIAVVKGAIVMGLQGGVSPGALASAANDIIKALTSKGNLYFTTVDYYSFNTVGWYQKFSYRKIYSDSARKKLIGTFQTEVTEGVNMMAPKPNTQIGEGGSY